jgi:GDP-L-fucose synthase
MLKDPFLDNKDAKIFVAGHNGMVGQAIVRQLKSHGYTNIITRQRFELDLKNQQAVHDFFEKEGPEYVFLAAAKVGGIHANNEYPAEFIYDNLMIQSNIIHSAFTFGSLRLLFLGSSCIYPKLAEQPMSESSLLTGTLEPTNEPYAIAKIAGIKLCESYNRQYGCDFRSVMPTNLYGPGDNFHPENSHVIPALIRRFHDAKHAQAESVEIWGTGSPKREFLHVDDMAAASCHVMSLPKDLYQEHTEPMLSHVNVGTGKDVSIRELAELISEVVGFKGSIAFNTDMPDGAPRKLMNVSLLERLGWKASVDLKNGLESAFHWYVTHQDSFRSK